MDTLASLLTALESNDKRTIRVAVDALIPLARQSPEIETRLNNLLNSSEHANRWPVAYVLANVAPPSQDTLRVLLESLDSGDPEIRWAIALLLVQLAKKDMRVADALLRVLSEGTSRQKRMAIYCIRDLALTDDASLRSLVNSLLDPDALVRVAAVTSLKKRPDVGLEERELLLQLFLEDPDGRVQYTAAVILAELGVPSEEFLSALERSTKNPNGQLRKAALKALAILDKKRSAPSGG